jgi:protein-S-isoprenylcysteine O-methyltransferase Ste14
MVLKGTALSILIFGAALCIPPFLTLRLFARSFKRARRRKLNGNRFLIAMAVAAVVFLFNLFVMFSTATSISDGDMEFGTLQVIAVSFSWIAFWVWIFLVIALGRDLGRRRGLR